MRLKSLGLETDLLYPRHFGKVFRRDECIVVKTPSRPNYFWGNYFIMPHAPKCGDFAKWRSWYDQEFDSAQQGFMTFAIDSSVDDTNGLSDFTAAGFTAKAQSVLTASNVSPPPKRNADATVREIKTEADWSQVADVHISDEWYLNPESQLDFVNQNIQDLRELSNAGLGRRFGAFLGEKLVADLGIYTSNHLGRFNEVTTHRQFRRQGLCGTLVYETALIAFQEMGVSTLVMVADENYHAAAIYESVGFNPTYRQTMLEWFDPAIHG